MYFKLLRKKKYYIVKHIISEFPEEQWLMSSLMRWTWTYSVSTMSVSCEYMRIIATWTEVRQRIVLLVSLVRH